MLFLAQVLSELKASGSCDLMAWLDKPETQLLFHDGFSEVRQTGVVHEWLNGQRYRLLWPLQVARLWIDYRKALQGAQRLEEIIS